MVFFPLKDIFFSSTCDIYGITKRLSKLEHDLVDVTPAPVFPWLEGLDNGVIGRVKMLGSVLIFRIVTAADMPAFQTEAQVDPGITRFQAILASIGTRCDLTYLVKMTTLFCHIFLLSFL